MSFAQLQLNPNIHKALSNCGYTTPTPIQQRSIPDILEGRDLIGCAQTGTGKTAAFVLPALHRLSTRAAGAKKAPRILILTPTRELASQITKAATVYGKFLRFNIVSLVGGMSYGPQIDDLKRGADIIVATPGRLMDHMQQKRINLAEIEMLILDEADRMLDMGFIDDVKYISSLTPPNRQTLLFSATMGKELANIIKQLMQNPIRINLSEKITVPQITQEMYRANNTQHKSRLLKHFLNDENIYKAIIFSATKVNADRLAADLRAQGFQAAALHGDLKQNVRNRTLQQLRNGKIQILVATDVAARGIDINDVTHVINYDLPRFCEDYVHRIGRTGRAGKNGIAISFVLPTDSRHLQKIERYIGQRIKLIHNVEIDGANGADEKPDYAVRIDRKPAGRKTFTANDRNNRAGEGSYRGKRSDASEGSYRGKRDASEGSYRGKRSDASEGPYRGKRSDASEGPYRGKRSDASEGPYRGKRTEGSQSSFRGKRSDDDSPRKSHFGQERSGNYRAGKPLEEGSYRSKAFRGKPSTEGSARSRQSDNGEEKSSSAPNSNITYRTKKKFSFKSKERTSGRSSGGPSEGRSFKKKPAGKGRKFTNDHAR